MVLLHTPSRPETVAYLLHEALTQAILLNEPEQKSEEMETNDGDPM